MFDGREINSRGKCFVRRLFSHKKIPPIVEAGAICTSVIWRGDQN
jgi:hypothetical protein